MKVLITGGTGYIGNSFLDYMKAFPDVEIDCVSLRGDEWKNVDFSIYDSVVHLAGLAHQKETKENAKDFYDINRDLTLELAKKCKYDGVKHFIFASSMSVYGKITGIVSKETELTPTTYYGKSKLEAEVKLEELEDLDFLVCCVRPPMVYGKSCVGNYKTLSKFAKKLPVFPLVENERYMIYIENLCEFLRLMLVHRESGVFMPQNREYVSTSMLVKEIATCAGKKIWLTKIFNVPLVVIAPFVGVVNKVFGSLVYEKSLSEYVVDYRVAGFEESVRRGEVE